MENKKSSKCTCGAITWQDHEVATLENCHVMSHEPSLISRDTCDTIDGSPLYTPGHTHACSLFLRPTMLSLSSISLIIIFEWLANCQQYNNLSLSLMLYIYFLKHLFLLASNYFLWLLSLLLLWCIVLVGS